MDLPLGTPKRADDDGDARQEQQVRHTVLALMREHLLPAGPDKRPRWHGRHFDLRNATFDGGTLYGIEVAEGTFLNFGGARVFGGAVYFGGAVFSGGKVNFNGGGFFGGLINFATPVDWSTPPRGMANQSADQDPVRRATTSAAP